MLSMVGIVPVPSLMKKSSGALPSSAPSTFPDGRSRHPSRRRTRSSDPVCQWRRRRAEILAQEAMEQKNVAAKTQAEMTKLRTEQGKAKASARKAPSNAQWLPGANRRWRAEEEGPQQRLSSSELWALWGRLRACAKAWLPGSHTTPRAQTTWILALKNCLRFSSLRQVQSVGPRQPIVAEFHDTGQEVKLETDKADKTLPRLRSRTRPCSRLSVRTSSSLSMANRSIS